MRVSSIRQFRKTLRQFERLLTTQLKDTCSCTGVTMAQCHALLEIEERGQAMTGELAESLGLDKSTVSRTIDGLVRLGLVERNADPADRRSMPLALTEQGRNVCAGINKVNDDYYQHVFNRIAPEQQGDVIGHFGMLVDALADYSSEAEIEPCHIDGDDQQGGGE